MQAKIIYTIVFLIAFALTTGAMIFLNNKYENIFKFNFNPSGSAREITAGQMNVPLQQAEKAKEQLSENIQQEDTQINENKNTDGKIAEDVKTGNNVLQSGQQNSVQKNVSASSDSLNKMKLALDQAKQKLLDKDKELQNAKTIEKARQDSTYDKWKKDIVKTYEKMDPRSVAKILINMNDNYARDILFSLKDKKRAQIIEIILNLSPETASRLTRTP